MRYIGIVQKVSLRTVLVGVVLFALTVIGAYDVVAEQLSTDDDGSFAWAGTASNGTDSIGYIMLSCFDSVGAATAYCYDNGTPSDETDDLPNVDVEPDPAVVASDDERIDGWAWVGSAYDGSDSSIGWLNFDPSPVTDFATANGGPCDVTYFGDTGGYPDEPCVPASLDPESGEVYGWARFETLADYGLSEFGHDDWGWVLLRGELGDDSSTSIIETRPFGLRYTNGRLQGWAWSANGTNTNGTTILKFSGLGWIDFSSSRFVNVGTASTEDYVSVEGGNVYARNGIDNPNTNSASNAAFLMVYGTNASNDFNDFSSTGDVTVGDTVTDDTGASVDQYYIEGVTDSTIDGVDYVLPANTNSNGVYTNALGSINVRDLVTNVDTTGIAPVNSYGNTLDLDSNQPYADITDWLATLTENPETGTTYVEFDDTVVVIDDDADGNAEPWNIPDPNLSIGQYVLNDALVFKNASGSENASGTIIVSGDLFINNNMYYNRTAISEISQLANVTWIVFGDVTVAPDVTNIVGSFFIFGDGGSSGGSRDGDFASGESTAQLQVSGLVMASGFSLERQYEGSGSSEEAAAELFYYDGRAVANPSPGLRDFSSTLPTFYQTIDN